MDLRQRIEAAVAVPAGLSPSRRMMPASLLSERKFVFSFSGVDKLELIKSTSSRSGSVSSRHAVHGHDACQKELQAVYDNQE